MNNPKISVIIPVYNVEKYLSECLDSVVNQTLRDIEIICINDGSTDSSLSILKEYASKDSRIKIIDKENQGQGYARKVGLDNAKGDYVLFLDSDDKYISNDVFNKLYCYIDNNSFDICIFDLSYWIYNKDNKITPIHYNYDKDKVIFKHDLWMCWNKIYRKSFLDSYDYWYFPIKHHLTQDVALHAQVLARANTIGYLSEPMVLYRIGNSNSATGKKIDVKRMLAPCIYIRKTHEVIKNILKYDGLTKEKQEQLKKEFVSFTISQLLEYVKISNIFNISVLEYIGEYQNILLELKDEFEPYIKELTITPYLNKEEVLFYKIMTKLEVQDLVIYFDINKLKEEKINNFIEDNNLDLSIKQKNNDIKNLRIQINIQEQTIKRLQNSWSYRIGRLFTYPLSIPLDFYRFIRDYNLIKKSGLFDSEYYLSRNEDVKKAKMNPIRHYLKFGWKEGRNPSEEFDGNEYLNKRPDVKVAGICPLVHYLTFGKYEK